MDNLLENLEKTGERHRSNVFSLAIAVGLIMFFITSESAGGLTGIQGFFTGTFSVLILYGLLVVFESQKSQISGKKIIRQQNIPSDVSVTQSDDKGITIHIHLSKDLSSSIKKEEV